MPLATSATSSPSYTSQPQSQPGSILKAAIAEMRPQIRPQTSHHSVAGSSPHTNTGDMAMFKTVLPHTQEVKDHMAHFQVEWPAGSTRQLCDDFDDDGNPLSDYPLTEITYPVNYGSLPGHVGEDGSDLDFLHGTSEGSGLSGKFVVKRPDIKLGTETKFFHACPPTELDQTLRAFGPVLHGRPTLHADPHEFLEDVKSFRVKPFTKKPLYDRGD